MTILRGTLLVYPTIPFRGASYTFVSDYMLDNSVIAAWSPGSCIGLDGSIIGTCPQKRKFKLMKGHLNIRLRSWPNVGSGLSILHVAIMTRDIWQSGEVTCLDSAHIPTASNQRSATRIYSGRVYRYSFLPTDSCKTCLECSGWPNSI